MKRFTAITRPFTADAGAPVRPAKAALNYLAVCVAVIAVVWASLAAAGISLNFDFVAQYRARIWDGFCMTVGISAASLVVSLVLGVLVAAGQGARFLPLRYLCDFTHVQTLRYVVAPQLVARTLPALTGQVASIIKDSSLLSVIAVIELTQAIREITATNYNFFGGFLLLGALYLVLTLPIMAVSRHFEKRLDYAH